jgi:hypothetical protein
MIGPLPPAGRRSLALAGDLKRDASRLNHPYLVIAGLTDQVRGSGKKEIVRFDRITF